MDILKITALMVAAISVCPGSSMPQEVGYYGLRGRQKEHGLTSHSKNDDHPNNRIRAIKPNSDSNVTQDGSNHEATADDFYLQNAAARNRNSPANHGRVSPTDDANGNRGSYNHNDRDASGENQPLSRRNDGRNTRQDTAYVDPQSEKYKNVRTTSVHPLNDQNRKDDGQREYVPETHVGYQDINGNRSYNNVDGYVKNDPAPPHQVQHQRTSRTKYHDPKDQYNFQRKVSSNADKERDAKNAEENDDHPGTYYYDDGGGGTFKDYGEETHPTPATRSNYQPSYQGEINGPATYNEDREVGNRPYVPIRGYSTDRPNFDAAQYNQQSPNADGRPPYYDNDDRSDHPPPHPNYSNIDDSEDAVQGDVLHRENGNSEYEDPGQQRGFSGSSRQFREPIQNQQNHQYTDNSQYNEHVPQYTNNGQYNEPVQHQQHINNDEYNEPARNQYINYDQYNEPVQNPQNANNAHDNEAIHNPQYIRNDQYNEPAQNPQYANNGQYRQPEQFERGTQNPYYVNNPSRHDYTRYDGNSDRNVDNNRVAYIQNTRQPAEDVSVGLHRGSPRDNAPQYLSQIQPGNGPYYPNSPHHTDNGAPSRENGIYYANPIGRQDGNGPYGNPTQPQESQPYYTNGVPLGANGQYYQNPTQGRENNRQYNANVPYGGAQLLPLHTGNDGLYNGVYHGENYPTTDRPEIVNPRVYTEYPSTPAQPNPKAPPPNYGQPDRNRNVANPYYHYYRY